MTRRMWEQCFNVSYAVVFIGTFALVAATVPMEVWRLIICGLSFSTVATIAYVIWSAPFRFEWGPGR